MLKSKLIVSAMCFFLLPFLIPTAAFAVRVNYAFEGYFENVVAGEQALLDEVGAGTRFIGEFSYETDAPLIYTDGTVSRYSGQDFTIEYTIFGLTETYYLTGTGAGALSTSNDASWGDSFGIEYITVTGSIAGCSLDEAHINFYDSTGTVSDHWSIPQEISLDNFDQNAFWLANYGDLENWFEIESKLDHLSVQPVPEPSTIILVFSGVMGMVGFRRKVWLFYKQL